MAKDIVVVGASAGGVEALMKLVGDLPDDLAAAVLVVLHVSSQGSVLPKLLQRSGKLPVGHAIDGDPIRSGYIYVAPPDRHMVLDGGRVRLAFGAKENSNRPSIDVMFRSAAWAFGARVLAVVLTGRLDDGAAGGAIVKREGGELVVQDPKDAICPDMPRAAIAMAEPDHVLALGAIGAYLVERVGRGPARTLVDPAHGGAALPDVVVHANGHPVGVPAAQLDETVSGSARRAALEMWRPANPDDQRKVEHDVVAHPSGLVCPACSGALWSVEAPDTLRFRCRVGHAYTEDTMVAGQAEAAEVALWKAIRTLEEYRDLTRRLLVRAHARGNEAMVRRYSERADQLDGQAAQLRSLLRTRVDSEADGK